MPQNNKFIDYSNPKTTYCTICGYTTHGKCMKCMKLRCIDHATHCTCGNIICMSCSNRCVLCHRSTCDRCRIEMLHKGEELIICTACNFKMLKIFIRLLHLTDWNNL